MNPSVLAKAQDRCRIAKKAFERMKAGATLEEQEDEWFTFLRAWKGIYTCLEQAVKGNARATMWFGQRNAFRRKDALLQYLYHARNDDEHGLTRTTERVPEGIAIGLPIVPGQPVRVGSIKFNIAPDGIRYTADSRSQNLAPPKMLPPSLNLVAVKDRDRTTVYDPPAEHLGKPFARGWEPLVVAEAALIYAETLLAEAKGF